MNILNIVNEYSQYQQHYASYSLAKAEGALDKVSNNPAEQNHSSIVHWCGTKLYDDPAYEVKVLLDRQQVLSDKRNQEKSRYHFAIQTALATDMSLKNPSLHQEEIQWLIILTFQSDFMYCQH